MAESQTCPHCEMPIPFAEERSDTGQACPYCQQPLDISPPPAVPSSIPALDESVGKPGLTRESGGAASDRRRFQFPCRRCGSVLEAWTDLIGRPGRCPTCSATFTIPNVNPAGGVSAPITSAAADDELPTPMHAYAAAGHRAPRIIRAADGSAEIICPRCAAASGVDADYCRTCGTPFTLDGADAVAAATRSTSPLAALSLALGVLFCLPVGPAAILTGALGWRSARRAGPLGRGGLMSMIGMVLGCIATLLWGLMLLG